MLTLVTKLWVLLVTVPDCSSKQPDSKHPVLQTLRCNPPWNFLNISLIPGIRHMVFSSRGMVSGSSCVTLLLLRRAQNPQFLTSTNLLGLSQPCSASESKHTGSRFLSPPGNKREIQAGVSLISELLLQNGDKPWTSL